MLPEPDEVAVHILTRTPVAGTVKTRLMPLLGPDGAAQAHLWLLTRTVTTAVAAAVGPVTLWCTPQAQHPACSRLASAAPVSLRDQPPGDLGMRMLYALASCPSPVGTLVIGSDCPALTPDHLRDVAHRLTSGDDAVFLPAEDGGYVLAAMRHPHPLLFDGVDWGTDQVMFQTRERLSSLGWRWSEPATLWDVDRPEDWLRLNHDD